MNRDVQKLTAQQTNFHNYKKNNCNLYPNENTLMCLSQDTFCKQF